MIFNILKPIAGAVCRRTGYDCLRNSYSKYIGNQSLTKFLFDIVFQILRRKIFGHDGLGRRISTKNARLAGVWDLRCLVGGYVRFWERGFVEWLRRFLLQFCDGENFFAVGFG